MKKTNLLPILSLSALSPLLPSTLFIPPSPPVLCWSEILEEQQAFPVCSGITVCDFSLTSQAALWHGGVIVSGGWKPFCHGRVEKDKAVPQPLCLAELCGLVSPPGGGYRLAHEWKVHMQDMATLALKWLQENCFWTCLSAARDVMSLANKVNGVIVGGLVWFNWYNCPAGDPQCTGGLYDAGLTWRGWLSLNNGPLLADHPQNHATLGQY